MLKIVSGKDDSKIYELATKEKNKVKFLDRFVDLKVEEAETKAQDISIFGEKEAFFVRMERESDLDFLTKEFFERLISSEHFFFLVGAGAEFDKKCANEKQKVEKVEAQVVFDFPAALVSAIQKKDKKNAWNLLVEELSKKDAEPIHGSAVFALKSLLVYLNDPKKNDPESGVKDFSWRQAKVNGTKREREETVNQYFNLIHVYHLAREGKGDLKTQLEKWILE